VIIIYKLRGVINIAFGKRDNPAHHLLNPNSSEVQRHPKALHTACHCSDTPQYSLDRWFAMYYSSSLRVENILVFELSMEPITALNI
jgi:hypothetical protein